jgi:hypothetical protein
LDLCKKVDRDGMPDLLLTLTSNEQSWCDVRERCGDLNPVTCPLEVFEQTKRRLDLLMKEIDAGNIFGPISGRCVKLEYQQRGSVHFHILIWMVDKRGKCKHVADS